MRSKRNIHMIVLSILSYAAASISIIAMSSQSSNILDGISVGGLLCGVCFWAFLLFGILLQIIVSFSVKKWCNRRHTERLPDRKRKWGLICFFSNTPAVISDLAFFISLLLFLGLLKFTNGTSIFAYISISMLLFSFCAHCIFNGKNFYYVSNYNKIIEKLKKMED